MMTKEQLIEAACEITPHAWTASFAGARAGLRPATADGLPVIGASRVVPNLMYATGHYRNGVLLGPLTGQRVADLVLNGTPAPEFEAFGPRRFLRDGDDLFADGQEASRRVPGVLDAPAS